MKTPILLITTMLIILISSCKKNCYQCTVTSPQGQILDDASICGPSDETEAFLEAEKVLDKNAMSQGVTNCILTE